MVKKTFLTYALLLGLAPLMTSCVTTQDHRNLQLKVRNQNNSIVEMEGKLDDLMAGGGDSTKTLQRQQADISTNIDRLKTQLLQIQGQLEEATFRNRTLLEENKAYQQQIETQMIALGEQDQETMQLLQTTSDQVSIISQTLEQEAQQRNAEAIRRAEIARQKALAAENARIQAQSNLTATQNGSTIVELKPRKEKGKNGTTTPPSVTTPASNSTITTSPVVEPPTVGKTPAEKLYDTGLSQYRSDDYKTAITTFSTFIENNGSHKLLPNAKYWLGASRLKDEDYSGAVLEFQHIVADYPKHPKAPEALLKQAEAFGHFGDKMVQKKLYNDVISYYPNSEQAKTAKAKLAKL